MVVVRVQLQKLQRCNIVRTFTHHSIFVSIVVFEVKSHEACGGFLSDERALERTFMLFLLSRFISRHLEMNIEL